MLPTNWLQINIWDPENAIGVDISVYNLEL
jgi:hypothetical protein